MLGTNKQTGQVNVMDCREAIKLHLQLLHERRDQVSAESKMHSARWGTPEYDAAQDERWMNKEEQASAELERAVNLARSAGLLINSEWQVVD